MKPEKRGTLRRKALGGSKKVNVSISEDQFKWLVRKGKYSPSKLLQWAIEEMRKVDP